MIGWRLARPVSPGELSSQFSLHFPPLFFWVAISLPCMETSLIVDCCSALSGSKRVHAGVCVYVCVHLTKKKKKQKTREELGQPNHNMQAMDILSLRLTAR